MHLVKNNTAFDLPREKLKQYFSRADLFFSRDTHLCFVCGAAGEIIPDSEQRSLRSMFLEHVSQRGDDKVVCVRAETALMELLRQTEARNHGPNFSSYEKIIADTVNSVLIFPESPGSYAELGLFSAYESIARKSLVAIEAQHQTNSFINLGPVYAISRKTRFNPITITDKPADQMSQIVDRLLWATSAKRTYRVRFSEPSWNKIDPREQLEILDEIIDLIGVTTEDDLLHMVKECFGFFDIAKIRLLLAILVAMNRIARNDNGEIFALKRESSFIELNNKKENISVKADLKATWLRVMQKYDPNALAELEEMRQ